MTNKQKAERYGALAADNISTLHRFNQAMNAENRDKEDLVGLDQQEVSGFYLGILSLFARITSVDAAHYGRLALAEEQEEEIN